MSRRDYQEDIARIKCGPFEFISAHARRGIVVWAIPGGRIMTTEQVRDLANRNNWEVRVLP